MNDGSLRTTFASGTGKYPDCLLEEMEIMSNTFYQVDQIVSDIIEVVVGNELKYQDEKTVYDLKDSPLKEHVHIYTKSNDFDGIGKMKYLLHSHHQFICYSEVPNRRACSLRFFRFSFHPAHNFSCKQGKIPPCSFIKLLSK